MVRWQLSLRFLLFGLMPTAALMALSFRSGEPRLVLTDDPYDIAVDGQGYLCITDEHGQIHQYVREGKLTVNSNGALCLRVQGKNRPLYPHMTMPSDTTHIEIDHEGRVLVGQTGQIQMAQQGQLPLYVFPAENIPELAPSVVTPSDETGTPFEAQSGTGRAGFLRQSCRRRTNLQLDRQSLGMLIAGLVLGSLTTALVLYRPRPPIESRETPVLKTATVFLGLSSEPGPVR